MLARVAIYILKNRTGLSLALDDASIPSRKNCAENAARCIAVDRKGLLCRTDDVPTSKLA